MKVKFETRESKSKRTKCVNGCSIFTCERFTQVMNADTGKVVAGERYCKHCTEYAAANWEDELVFDDERDDEAGLRQRERYAAHQAAGCVSEFWSNEDYER